MEEQVAIGWLAALPVAATAALASLAALAVDRFAARRGLTPPGFANPWRRGFAAALLALVFWLGIFGPLALADPGDLPAPDQVSRGGLFLIHGILAVSLAIWYALGFAAVPGTGGLRGFLEQLGLAARRPAEEAALGIVAGVAIVAGVFVVALVVAVVATVVLGENALPDAPPGEVLLVAGLPIWLRLALSLSAGAVEETFFRGLLQPRTGILFSTGLFVLAHASYQSAPMLLNLLFVSLVLGWLVRWRQSVWAAVFAHAVFDAVQLLVVIPLAVHFLPEAAVPAFVSAALYP